MFLAAPRRRASQRFDVAIPEERFPSSGIECFLWSMLKSNFLPCREAFPQGFYGRGN